jgi:hypothetical protein
MGGLEFHIYPIGIGISTLLGRLLCGLRAVLSHTLYRFECIVTYLKNYVKQKLHL